jgi:peptidoglycan/LPS O-acetylase OafA/YrhL
MPQKRVDILDSFRFLAIIAVMCFHFMCRWTAPLYKGNLYPYGSFYGNLFKYGGKGVEFFFIISGFVISYTLENTPGPAAFFKNRFIRLFPPILFWSIVTYLVFITLDNHLIFPEAHELKNLLFSITFINPELTSIIFKSDVHWINGSYWSLWVEVQFYVLAAILYYTNRKSFFQNLLLITILLSLANYIPYPRLQYFNELFNLSHYISYFTLGSAFQYLYKGERLRFFSIKGICVFFIFVFQVFTSFPPVTRLLFVGMVILFLLMIYKGKFLSYLDNPLFRRIGVISYSVYLAHERIGVLMINKYGGLLGKWSILAPWIVLVFVIILAEMSYRFIEQRSSRFLKKQLFRSKVSTKSVSLSK